MPKNVKMKAIYSCLSDAEILIPVANKLSTIGVEPVYWSGNNSIKKEVVSAYPNLIFHNQKDGLSGKWPEEIAQKNIFDYLSKDILNEYANVQKVYMEMAMTRAGGRGEFSWYELASYFHSALSGALAMVELLKPDVWISTTPPHYMYDYVMYEVCKRKGVKTLMFVHTHLLCRSLLVNSIDYKPVKLIDAVQRTDTFEMSGELAEYVRGVRSNYKEGIPLLIKKNYDADDYQKYEYKNLLTRLNKRKKKLANDYYKTLLKSKFVGDIKTESEHYLKQPNKCWSKSYVLKADYLFKRLNDAKDRLKLLKGYFEKVSDVDLTQKYIYFPMNKQPECTTVPQAGVFSDQILSLQMLSQSLPDGWRIYVKECPALFEWHRGSFARHDRYYDDIASIDNVHFVPLTADPFVLIDKSQAVVCSTGTAGWEALLRGIPVMMLGSLYWYKGFPGLMDVQSVKEMRDFFCKLRNGKLKLDSNEVDKYIYALHESTYRCSFDEMLLEHFDISNKENIEQISQAIVDAI